jgi:myo-inositol-1(or 4)-monophosphatase
MGKQDEDLAAFKAAALTAARRGGAILFDLFGKIEHIAHKGPIDLVTEADQQAEAAIVAALTARFPDHQFIAEEGTGAGGGPAAYRWLIDPLDGTTNYAHGNPYFAVSIALQHNGETLCAVVHDPTRGETFTATRGGGATLNDQPIRVSTTADPTQALIGTDFPYNPAHRPLAVRREHAFADAVQAVRRHGATALDLCYVAAGRFDGFFEGYLKPWDCAAGALIVCEAGGRISDFQGGPFDPFQGDIVASNAHLHAAMLAVLAATK